MAAISPLSVPQTACVSVWSSTSDSDQWDGRQPHEASCCDTAPHLGASKKERQLRGKFVDKQTLANFCRGRLLAFHRPALFLAVVVDKGHCIAHRCRGAFFGWLGSCLSMSSPSCSR